MSTDQLEFCPPLEIYCVPHLNPAFVRETFAGLGDRLLVELFLSDFDPKTGRVVLDFSEKLTLSKYEEVIESLSATKDCVITVGKLPVRVHQAA